MTNGFTLQKLTIIWTRLRNLCASMDQSKGMLAHRLEKLWNIKTNEVDSWMRKNGANEAKSESKTKHKT